MLAAAAVVATNVDGQTGSRTPFAPDVTTSSSGTSILGFSPIAPTATATSFLLSAPTRTPTARTVAQSAPSPSASATSSPQASLNTAAVTAQQTATLPPPGAQIGSPVSLPGEPGPAGPVLAAYTAYSTYTVQPGDTLNQVASQFGVSGDTIVRTSGLQDPNLLQPGQVLTIPRESGWLYRVQPGETLEMIALRFGVMVSDVVSANSLVTSVVHAGDLLFIPSRGTPAPKQ
jgi:LysM repeat protein